MKKSVQDIPAIAGGNPTKTVPYGTRTRYGKEELKQLKEVIDKGTLFYVYGNKVKDLERRIAGLTGTEYAVAASSGTSSIHAAMIALGISPGDEIITAPITDMGSLIPILYQGAVPVFADICPHSYTLSPQSVEERITDRTRAVLAIHLWGNACDLAALKAICLRHNLFLIEDCAQAWGCTYKGRSVGAIGNIGCFSMNESKHISCGEGGVTVAGDKDIARRLRLATDKCYDRESGAAFRDPSFLANNYRMSELQAAIALAQLDKLAGIVERRRWWGTELSSRLHDLEGITLPQPTSGCDPTWWFYMLRVKPEKLGCNADEYAAALKAEGLGATAHYIGRCVYEYLVFTRHSAFERSGHPYEKYDYHTGLCPIAEKVLETGVVLPVSEAFTDIDLEETAEAICRVTRWFMGKA
ncbi:MAG: DegT/DnrJ/EryC1/StrS family aminotransferase [bacterium]|nr:DegT/DnrJ/EryC1/StrS family aminotransferase [bacterium]